jgi:prepilin-type N-terminal cleavage/methylation domain-containing protein
MSFKNLKDMKSEKGFTIVELLIVIIVIGILAAIIIVAYNGVTNKAKATKSQAAAASVIKKAEAYNAFVGSYPGTGGVTATTGFSTASPSDGSVSLQGSGVKFEAITSGTAPSTENSVEYIPCTTTAGVGAQVSWYDYSKSSAQKTTQNIGAACTTPGAAYVGGAY